MAAPNGLQPTRAERFEDEKRRIIESCFSRREEDGSSTIPAQSPSLLPLQDEALVCSSVRKAMHLDESKLRLDDAVLETYITHIKITEFSSNPTSPPPPQARTPSSEKPRVIIVAVRRSGRVRMHKSKENQNGSYSIGKTWDLDALTALESYTAATTSPDARQWAGTVGFCVSLGKPYYWEAQTDKEKKFFIASLLKIYGKYTGGRVPQLSGFDQQELDQILGGAQRRQASAALEPPARSTPPPVPSPSQTPVPSTGPTNTYVASAVPELNRGSSRSPIISRETSSPAGSFDSGRSANREALRRLAGSNKSQDSVAASMTARSEDASSIPPRSRNGPVNGVGAFGLADTPAPEERPPERRRPPMDPTRPQDISDKNLVPAPLMSSTRGRDPIVPPRSSDRTSPRKASVSSRTDARSETGSIAERTFRGDSRSENISLPDRSSPAPEAKKADVAPLRSPLNGSSTTIATEPSEPIQSPEPPPEPEEVRPGLGPMIKKKSKGDIAGAFWKAAAAASAFKPRPGGAGDRLRQAQNKTTDGPDGITGVVPAPPRPVSVEKPKASPEERPKTPQRTSGIPEVKVTVPQSDRPLSAQNAVKEVGKPVQQQAKSPQPDAPEDHRKSVVVGNDLKYLATLGIDPSLMDARSVEFTKWLDYFGWVPGEQMRSTHFDEMKIDIDRELNKAQAGGWLARFQEEDDRVDSIRKGIDVAITECEELDNLLTLYSVELSVSPIRSTDPIL